MKVGIITHYYRSRNYGGNLQAYSLCRVIKKIGHNVEQISLDRAKHKSLKFHLKQLIVKILSFQPKCFFNIKKRSNYILKFNRDFIPHSVPYSEKTIKKCVSNYDAFVVGSDQVWHPNAVCDAFLIQFVSSKDNKIKISYSASVACDHLTDEQRERYRKALIDFNAISVRERDAVDLLQELTSKQVQWVLDPTLLLDDKEWNGICADRIVDEKYIFCYFLGNSVEQRNVAEEFAKKHGLKLVTLPYLNGKYRKCDKNFGDIRLFDVGPQEFLSLIKYADFVFTDSFHAMVFAGIYKRQHFEFLRDNKHNMSSRIYSLCELYETADHFCDTPEKTSLEYIESVSPINYERPLEKLSQMKEKSLNYLKENLR